MLGQTKARGGPPSPLDMFKYHSDIHDPISALQPLIQTPQHTRLMALDFTPARCADMGRVTRRHLRQNNTNAAPQVRLSLCPPVSRS